MKPASRWLTITWELQTGFNLNLMPEVTAVNSVSRSKRATETVPDLKPATFYQISLLSNESDRNFYFPLQYSQTLEEGA